MAVKVYQRELDQGDRRRFFREAAAVGRLSNHHGVVTAHGAGILPDDRPYLVMEFCPGGSLTRWLKPGNQPGEEQVRQVGVRIADALAAVHACGVLHRDVKPANILIDRYGNPRLADFGLATVVGAESPDALRLTPAYAPPEAFGRQPATEFGDVFSLAATMYAGLAGVPPRDVASVPLKLDQLVKLAQRPIPPLAGVDGNLMSVLLVALSNDVAARPTAEGFREQLVRVAAPRKAVKPPVEAAQTPSSAHSSSRSLIPVISAVQPARVSHRVRHRDSPGSVPAAWPSSADQVASAAAPGRPAVRQGGHRRGQRAGLLAVAAALVTVVASATAWLINVPATRIAVPSVPSANAEPAPAPDPASPPPVTPPRNADGNPDSGSAAKGRARSAVEGTIQLRSSADSAMPFQTIPIQGTYRGGEDTLLRVQRWEAGKWLAFPLPAKTDQSGRFNAYVELGEPSRYRLRVLDPDSGLTSEPFVLEIKG